MDDTATTQLPAVADLTLKERAGQVLCLGWRDDEYGPATTYNAHARAIIEGLHTGAIVLMGRNLGSPEEARTLVSELQSRSAVPLLVAIDQEGGLINRFGADLHQFPGNMALGAIYDPVVACALARRQAEAQADELLSLGIQWDFAPSADVNNNPDNPVIGVRSYGDDPERVGALAAAAIDGYQSSGVMASAKHFPSHGDTDTDSHLALPRIVGDLARLRAVELPPFRAAIEAGVASVMTSHIVFPALDPERPATLSPTVLNGLLRADLGFRGLVITDCLEMDAISRGVGAPRGAVMALQAGADMALICHTLEAQRDARNAIVRAVRDGELTEDRLNEAVGRVLDAKRIYAANRAVSSGTPWVSHAHDVLELEIAQRSVTLVRDNGSFAKVRSGSSVVVSAHPAGQDLAESMRGRGLFADALTLGRGISDDGIASAAARARAADSVVVATAFRGPWPGGPIDQLRQSDLVRMLHGVCRDRLVCWAVRDPYDLRYYRFVGTYVCTYGYRPCSIRALAGALAGEFAPSGRLPVTIPNV